MSPRSHTRSETHSDDGSASSPSHRSGSASDRDEKPVLPFPPVRRLPGDLSGAHEVGGDGAASGWVMASREREGSYGPAECGGASGGSGSALPLVNGQTVASGPVSTRTQPTFVLKLFAMVKDPPEPPEQPLICWSRGGEMFAVYNHVDFSKAVLPEYFKHNNWQSFVRQLNMYGFHKVNDVLSSSAAHAAQAWEFQHPHFRRGRPDLLQFVKRKTTRNNAVSNYTGAVASLLPPPPPSTRLSPFLASSPAPASAYTAAHLSHPPPPLSYPPSWPGPTPLVSCSPSSTGRIMPDHGTTSPALGSSSGYYSPSKREHIARRSSTEGEGHWQVGGHGLHSYNAPQNSVAPVPQPGSLVSLLIPPRPPTQPPPPTKAQLDAVRLELEQHTEAMYRQGQDDIADKHQIAAIFRSMLNIIQGLAEGRYGPSPVLPEGREENKEGRLKLLEDFEAAKDAVAKLDPVLEENPGARPTSVTPVAATGASAAGCFSGGQTGGGATNRAPLRHVSLTGSAREWWTGGAGLACGKASRPSVGSSAPDQTEWSPSPSSAPPVACSRSAAEFAPAALNGDAGGGKVQLPSIQSMLPQDGGERQPGPRFTALNGAGRRMDEEDEREAPKRGRYY